MKKGFTLVELLAVILLLGIIGTIIVINYNRYMEASRISAFKDSMYSLIEQLEEYQLDNRKLDLSSEQQIPFADLELDNKKSLSGSFKIQDNYVVLVNVTDGKYCANGNKNTLSSFIREGKCK